MKAERTSSSPSRSTSSRPSRSAGQSSRGTSANTSNTPRGRTSQTARTATVIDGVALSGEAQGSGRRGGAAQVSESTSVSDLMSAWGQEPAAEPAEESGADLARSIEGDLRKLDGGEPNAALEGALEQLGRRADQDLSKLDGPLNETLQRVLSFLDESARTSQPQHHDRVGVPR